MFSHSVLNAFSQTELRESDSVRINLRRCSGAAATSLFQWLTEPVTFGWVWDYWCFICAVVAHLRLLRLSYVKMRDCQTKPQGCDNNLSVSGFLLPLPLSFCFNLSVFPLLLSDFSYSLSVFQWQSLYHFIHSWFIFPSSPPYFPLPRSSVSPPSIISMRPTFSSSA